MCRSDHLGRMLTLRAGDILDCVRCGVALCGDANDLGKESRESDDLRWGEQGRLTRACALCVTRGPSHRHQVGCGHIERWDGRDRPDDLSIGGQELRLRRPAPHAAQGRSHLRKVRRWGGSTSMTQTSLR